MIGFQSGGRLITDWAGQACVRHTAARVYVTRKEKKNFTGYISTDQPTTAGGLLVVVYRKKSSLKTRETSYEGGPRRGERYRGGYRRPGSRAYDIKHYNYYLNSSRMAPGVAAPSSSRLSLPVAPIMPSSLSLAPFLFVAAPSSLSRLLSLFHPLASPLCPLPSSGLLPLISSYGRAATRFLLSYTGRLLSSTDRFAFSKSLCCCYARA